MGYNKGERTVGTILDFYYVCILIYTLFGCMYVQYVRMYNKHGHTTTTKVLSQESITYRYGHRLKHVRINVQ